MNIRNSCIVNQSCGYIHLHVDWALNSKQGNVNEANPIIYNYPGIACMASVNSIIVLCCMLWLHSQLVKFSPLPAL